MFRGIPAGRNVPVAPASRGHGQEGRGPETMREVPDRSKGGQVEGRWVFRSLPGRRGVDHLGPADECRMKWLCEGQSLRVVRGQLLLLHEPRPGRGQGRIRRGVDRDGNDEIGDTRDEVRGVLPACCPLEIDGVRCPVLPVAVTGNGHCPPPILEWGQGSGTVRVFPDFAQSATGAVRSSTRNVGSG